MCRNQKIMRSFRQPLCLASLIGILFCMSCGQPNSRVATEAEKQAKSEADTKEAIEKELSSFAERHKAMRNWLSFAEGAAIDHQVFTLQYQDALTDLNGQSIIVVGSVVDVRRIDDRYRMLFRCVVEPSRQFKPNYLDLEVTFDLEADTESVKYIIEMTKKHKEENEPFRFLVGFAIAVSPTRLRVTYDRDVSAEGSDDGGTGAEVVEGKLYPHFTILGQCREVRYLKGFDPF